MGGCCEVSAGVLAKVREKAPEGKITCSQARALAVEMKVTPAVIGEACNILKIKIKACELGCF
jgi:hypothetical protein